MANFTLGELRHCGVPAKSLGMAQAKTRKQKTPNVERNAPLGRDDWTEAAWQLLGRGSLNEIRVDALARHLKVTRGSFYWHFRDRDDLIEAILDRWFAALGLDRSMLPALRDIVDPRQRLWTIYERVIHEVGSGQFAALRLWARSNAGARRKLAEEDRKRLEHIIQQFSELGFSPTEAAVRGDIYHALIQGEYLRNGLLPLNERLSRARIQHDAILIL